MRGIEAAFWGTLGRDPEPKTSKAGKPFCTLNVAVTSGHDDAGKDVTQWLRVAIFGETTERISAACKKMDRIYCEGALAMTEWTDKASGERRHGLNVAAWRCEKVGAIGRNRAAREAKPENGEPQREAGGRYAYPCQPPAAPPSASQPDFDDEIPL